MSRGWKILKVFILSAAVTWQKGMLGGGERERTWEKKKKVLKKSM